MRCVAIIEAERPEFDNVIVWADQDRLIAIAYLEGKVTMTRPLNAVTLTDAATEVSDNFQITEGQMTRITDWSLVSSPPKQIAADRARW